MQKNVHLILKNAASLVSTILHETNRLQYSRARALPDDILTFAHPQISKYNYHVKGLFSASEETVDEHVAARWIQVSIWLLALLAILPETITKHRETRIQINFRESLLHIAYPPSHPQQIWSNCAWHCWCWEPQDA